MNGELPTLVVVLDTIWTLVVCFAFLGIAVWAYGRGRRDRLDRYARIPLEDDVPGAEEEHERWA